MKKIRRTLYILLIIVVFAVLSCNTGSKPTVAETNNNITDAQLETAIIYEANIRQYSPEGTFNAFTKDIPKLKELGVSIIWLMPIHPISIKNRKAEGDLMVHDIEDPEVRKKYLGSYYAVADYSAVNPEFGTLEDFRALVKEAHAHNMYVILDWVPNHTGWDHAWISTNPDYYTKNDKNEITDPLNEDGSSIGWTDVADLNYDNPDLHEAMIKQMAYWVEEEGIDGFRCDVAGSVPLKFWRKAIPALRAIDTVFMLAEAWEPELLHDNLFEMAYAWEGHHVMNQIAKGEKSAAEWDAYITRKTQQYEANDILMNFVTNHDENSWNGTIQERMGPNANLFTVLSCLTPGMPLIYSGQEYDLNHRLKFFEKDSIPKTKGSSWELLTKLANLKTTREALHGGKNPAAYKPLMHKYNILHVQYQQIVYIILLYVIKCNVIVGGGSPEEVK